MGVVIGLVEIVYFVVECFLIVGEYVFVSNDDVDFGGIIVY